MQTAQIIAAVRDGQALGADNVAQFAKGLADGSVSDAQAGAFAMAVYLKGLSPDDRVSLTQSMRDSGKTLTWDLPGPVLDKHSTGGIGDCVSLVLAPALAALGVFVPMVSGRGLGHTGGTLDKLEAITGVSTDQPEDRFRKIVADVGCAIVAASADVAPADKRLYGVRDVTGTVDQVDLICASILSKKLAISPQALVLDIKQGSGAFMQTPKAARELARILVGTANGAGCATIGLITDMNQPVAPAIGNAVEVVEVLRTLRGQPGGRLGALTEALGAELLAKSEACQSVEAGEKAIRAVLSDGSAARKFDQMIAAMGGPDAISKSHKANLPKAKVVVPILADRAGWLSGIDGVALGQVVVELGGGRKVQSDVIDHAVGLSQVAALGTKMRSGQVLAKVHTASQEDADRVASRIASAFTFSDAPFEAPPLIYDRID